MTIPPNTEGRPGGIRSPTHIIDAIDAINETARIDDMSAPAAAFSQVSGVLGGFCITIVVLALSPSVIGNIVNKDRVVALVLLAGGLYIISSGTLANAMSFKKGYFQNKVFNFGILSFHIANIVLAFGIITLIDSFPELQLARIAGIIIFGVIIWYAVFNLFPRVALFIYDLVLRTGILLVRLFFSLLRNGVTLFLLVLAIVLSGIAALFVSIVKLPARLFQRIARFLRRNKGQQESDNIPEQPRS
jgi:hypothetical protein